METELIDGKLYDYPSVLFGVDDNGSYPLTECCYAPAMKTKLSITGVACSKCYLEHDPEYGERFTVEQFNEMQKENNNA